MRVLLDTNVLISYLLAPDGGGATTRVVQAGMMGGFQMLLPEELLEEVVVTVRTHDHLAQRIPVEDLRAFVDLVSREGETIPRIKEAIPAVTCDPEDDYLIAYALVGQADYLVSGDKDLLVLDQIGDIVIVTPAEFLQLVGQQ